MFEENEPRLSIRARGHDFHNLFRDSKGDLRAPMVGVEDQRHVQGSEAQSLSSRHERRGKASATTVLRVITLWSVIAHPSCRITILGNP